MRGVKKQKVLCGVSKCRNSAKIYGVCGTHSRYAFSCDDPDFLRDLESHRQVMLRLNDEDSRLSQSGHHLLAIQRFWDWNLSAPRRHSLPEHFALAGSLMEKLVSGIERMKQKYDQHLVSNACVIVRHSTNPSKCTCFICSLGQHLIPSSGANETHSQ